MIRRHVRRRVRRRVAFALVVPLSLASLRAGAAVGTIETISVADDPPAAVGNSDSDVPQISATGRFVAFDSTATDLVAGGTSNVGHIFVRDRETGTTSLVTVNTAGAEANGFSYTPHISPDGRFVAFHSHATNLAGSDANGDTRDIYLRDRTLGTTERISVSNAGVQNNLESAFGTVSDDGRFVVFTSMANNLVEGDTNGKRDVFIRDRVAGTTERVSEGRSGQGNDHSSGIPVVSATGRYVAFDSNASNLVKGDTNRGTDVFVSDRAARTIERVSVTNKGKQATSSSLSPWISADGRFVVFESFGTNLGLKETEAQRAIYIRDRSLRRTEPVSIGPGGTVPARGAVYPSVSGDGRVVVFLSFTPDLVAGDTNGLMDAFLRDRVTKKTERISVTPAGGEFDSTTTVVRVSRDGSSVVYSTESALVAAGDGNASSDVFVAEILLPASDVPPVARAGDDQTVTTPGKSARVQLDGTTSSDPEGSKLRFKWSRYGKTLSTSSRPKVTLPQGVHTLTLTVTDSRGLLGIDDVVITVAAP